MRQNNAMAMSAALSFRTIFTLIPLLLLAFLFLKSVGKVEQSRELLHNFLDESGFTKISLPQNNGVPIQDETKNPDETPNPNETEDDPALAPPVTPANHEPPPSVADQLESMLATAESQLTFNRLGPIGVLLLAWTALTLLTTMERSLNRIFEAPRSRSVIRRVLLYWSVVTFGPVVLVAVSYSFGLAADNVRNIAVLSWVLAILEFIGPGLVGILLLAILYTTMPNTHVSFRSALQASLIALPLWLVGRWAFSLYVLNVVSSQSLYGALALLPLFLLWMNISWWIFLFGAELSHSMMHLSRMQETDDRILGPWDYLAAVVAVARRNLTQESPVTNSEVATSLALTTSSASRLLRSLKAAGILARVESEEDEKSYLPARPASKILVRRILSLGSPEMSDNAAPDMTEGINSLRRKTESGIENLTIADILDR